MWKFTMSPRRPMIIGYWLLKRGQVTKKKSYCVGQPKTSCAHIFKEADPVPEWGWETDTKISKT